MGRDSGFSHKVKKSGSPLILIYRLIGKAEELSSAVSGSEAANGVSLSARESAVNQLRPFSEFFDSFTSRRSIRRIFIWNRRKSR